MTGVQTCALPILSLPESSSTPQSTSLSLPHSPHQLFSIPSPPLTQSSPNSMLVSPLSAPSVSAIPQVPVSTPSSINTHPMITRSEDGIFKPKALAAQLSYDQFLSDHSTSAVSIVKVAKSSKIKSASKLDYTITELPSYRITAQYPQWCLAMDDEFAALQRQGTWTLVPPSPSQNLVGCKWVYKLKHNSDGSISRYKARLVAKGFHQQYGVDFEETFGLVIKPPTVRIILSLAA